MEDSKVQYVLRDTRTGGLIRIDTESNAGRSSCGNFTYRLRPSDEEHLPVYVLGNPERLARIIKNKSENWYNSAYDRPVHNEIEVEYVEIVKQTIVTTSEVVEIELPPAMKSVHHARKPQFLLKRYAGVDELPVRVDTLDILILPPGETVQSLKRFEGRVFELSGWRAAYVYKFFAVPNEEYESYLNGQSGVAAVISEYWDDVKPAEEA